MFYFQTGAFLAVKIKILALLDVSDNQFTFYKFVTDRFEASNAINSMKATWHGQSNSKIVLETRIIDGQSIM